MIHYHNNMLNRCSDYRCWNKLHSWLVTYILYLLVFSLSLSLDASKKSGQALVGDVDYQDVLGVAGWVTPVPGGVGPMTVAMLMKNTLQCARRLAEREVSQEKGERKILSLHM